MPHGQGPVPSGYWHFNALAGRGLSLRLVLGLVEVAACATSMSALSMSDGAFLVLVHLSSLWHWPGTEEPRAEAKEGRRHWLLLKCAVRVICVTIKQSYTGNRGCTIA